MNGPRSLRQIIWYPPAINFPRLDGIAKGAIEQIMTVATALNKDASQRDTKYRHEEERFRGNHTDKDTPVGRPLSQKPGKSRNRKLTEAHSSCYKAEQS